MIVPRAVYFCKTILLSVEKDVFVAKLNGKALFHSCLKIREVGEVCKNMNECAYLQVR